MDIRASEIFKEFERTAALHDVSLDVRSGELMALLGPSGSGKTTLLRIIAGLVIPDSGRVFFDGEDATALPVQKRGVGFVFQHYALFKHMTVLDNVAYGLRVRDRAHRPSEAVIRGRVYELLKLVQLDGLEGRYPAQLSGGQRQRIALARALAVEPRVLLLDEPFGALDAKVRKDLRRWLRHIHEQTGQTTVFVTHDQDEALELADRVAILNDGHLEQVGTPDEIYDKPASAFVMSFVGETAQLPVRLSRGKVWHGQRLLPVPAAGTDEGEADLYLRPWDLMLTDNADAPITGVVHAVRRTAAGRRADIRLNGCGTLVEMDVPLPTPIASGDPIRLEILHGRVFPRGPGPGVLV